jgi:hypothetical protein
MTSVRVCGSNVSGQRSSLPISKLVAPKRSNFGVIVFASLIIMSIAGFGMTLMIADLKFQISNLERQLANTRVWVGEVEKEQGDENSDFNAQIIQLQNIVADHQKRLENK